MEAVARQSNLINPTPVILPDAFKDDQEGCRKHTKGHQGVDIGVYRPKEEDTQDEDDEVNYEGSFFHIHRLRRPVRLWRVCAD